MAYWSNDIGGWQYLPAEHRPAHPPLLDGSDARDNIGGYEDYPELYTAGSSTAPFCPSSALTAAACTTRSGPMEKRPSRFWKSI